MTQPIRLAAPAAEPGGAVMEQDSSGAASLRRTIRRLRSSEGSQLLEFGLALPILLLLVVGAWDFGYAFQMRDKLTNAAREAARVSISNSLIDPYDPSAACYGSSTPCTIEAAADAAVKYMNNAGLNASCISPDSPTSTSGLEFTYTCNGITLVVNRGLLTTVNGEDVEETQVSIAYPMAWKLANFLPKGTFPATVSTAVTMLNLS
jgi:Flp pilus assembly protein TadG